MRCIEDEIPFEVPEGWAWTHLSNINLILNGDRGQNYPAKSKLQAEGIPFVSASNIESGIVSAKDLLCMTEAQYDALRAGKLVKGDIVYCIRGSLGKCGIFMMEKGAIASSLVIVRSIFSETNIVEYTLLYLKSALSKKEIRKYDNGSAQPNLAAKDFMHFLIPVPPIREIGHIVNKTKKLLSIVDSIENDKKELYAIIKQLKDQILNLAIRGQLVPQNPNDEPASALLERIRSEKEALIQQGKIKRDKKESFIFRGDDKSYYETVDGKTIRIENAALFDLPDNWTWCRIRNISSVKGGKRLPKGYNFSDIPTSHAYIRVTDMKNQTINTDELKYISDEIYEQIKTYTISKEDLYVTIAGTIGVVGEVPEELDGMNLTENAVKVCDIKIDKEYLCYVLSSKFVQEQFQEKTHQVAMPKLALERILSTFIPLPPYKEQLLIVKQLKNVLNRITAIANSL